MSESKLRTLLWQIWARLKTIDADGPLTRRVGEVLNETPPERYGRCCGACTATEPGKGAA